MKDLSKEIKVLSTFFVLDLTVLTYAIETLNKPKYDDKEDAHLLKAFVIEATNPRFDKCRLPQKESMELMSDSFAKLFDS